MKQICILFFLVLHASFLTAQTPLTTARQFAQQKKYKEAQASYQTIATEAQQNKDWERYAQAVLEGIELAEIEAKAPQIQAFLQKGAKEIELLKKELGEKNKQIGWWYFSMSRWHTMNDEHKKGQSYRKMAKEILDSLVNDQDYKAPSYYVYKREYFWNKGSYEESKIYLDKAKQLYIERYGEDCRQMVHILLMESFYQLHFNTEGVRDSRKTQAKAINIANKYLPAGHVDFAQIYFYQGITEHYGPSSDKTIPEKYFLKATEVWEANGMYSSAANAYLNAGVIFKDTRARFIPGKDPNHKLYREKAVFYFRKAIETFEKSKIRPSENIALAYLNLAYLISESTAEVEHLPNEKNWLAQMPTILTCMHNGLVEIMPDAPKSDINYVPDYKKPLPFVLNPVLAMRLLTAKASCFKETYTRTKNADYLKLEGQAWLAVEQLVTDVEKNTINVEDKKEWLAHLKNAYFSLIDFEYRKYEASKDKQCLATIFELIEKSKSVFLLRSLSSEEKQRASGLPSDLAAEEMRLKQEMSNNKKALLDAIAEDGNNRSTERLKTKRFEITKQYEAFTQKLKTQYPQYYKMAHESQVVSLADFQQNLEEGTTLLNFLSSTIGDIYYVLSVSNKKVSLKKIETQSAGNQRLMLNTNIKNFRDVLANWEEIKSNPTQSYRNFAKYSKIIHDSLYLSKLIPSGSKRLLISPDGMLNDIPFEVLLKTAADTSMATAGDYNQLDYLLKTYAIQYSYSATLLQYNQQNYVSRTGRIAGYAPTYGQFTSQQMNQLAKRNDQERKLRLALEDLPGAKQELELLQTAYGGDYYFDSLATEAEFKRLDFSQYSVIHLAMHGLMNKENVLSSAMAFTENGDSNEDNFLYFNEIISMRIPTELVVLSACETGYGKFENGEGALSLARSFMYAGVPSLVMTLWEVNDASTSNIMEVFYKNLAAGMDKAEALRQAKIDYLSKAKGAAAHPAFWSPFLQLGDVRPIGLGASGNWKCWALVASVFVLLLVFLGKRLRVER